MIEYLVQKLLTGTGPSGQTAQPFFTLATLSRGYGRSSKGFRIATPTDTAQTIGDEPMQLYQKFGQKVVVAVAERRVEGFHQLSSRCPQVGLVLLDDAFQHRAIQPHLNILLTDYNRPFYQDHPFPEGRLRERRVGAKRADVIIVTKCPNTLSETEKKQIIDELIPYKDTSTPVFFAGLRYDVPKDSGNQSVVINKTTVVVLISGLANADPLEAYVRQTFELARHYRFGDHYAYSRTSINPIIQNLPDGGVILTTEKDWVKLYSLLTAKERDSLPIYYLPVGVKLLDREADFLAIVAAAISS